jgi:hypothetical protein
MTGLRLKPVHLMKIVEEVMESKVHHELSRTCVTQAVVRDVLIPVRHASRQVGTAGSLP